MIRELPTFKGWTVDVRLAQFRRVGTDHADVEFLDFGSEEGDNLLVEYIHSLDQSTESGMEMLNSIIARII